MPLAGFEPKIPLFKRAKTFHALDRAATVTGHIYFLCPLKYNSSYFKIILICIRIRGTREICVMITDDVLEFSYVYTNQGLRPCRELCSNFVLARRTGLAK
jgi:hypothetical protein